MNIALWEKRSVTFPYYYKKIDIFYDVVVNVTEDGHGVDIFCVDSTELHHAQKQLGLTNQKLSMALDVANIVPWKWDLQAHTGLKILKNIFLKCSQFLFTIHHQHIHMLGIYPQFFIL